MTVRRPTFTTFEVDVKMSGHEWTYTLKGSPFTSRKKAEVTARDLAFTSREMFVNAAMIKQAISRAEAKTDQQNRTLFLFKQAASRFEELALSVPSYANDFDTGSRGHYSPSVNTFKKTITEFRSIILDRCPPPSDEMTVNTFMHAWGKNMLIGFPRTTRTQMLDSIYENYDRSKNKMALKGRSETAEAEIIDLAFKIVTAHIPTFLPVIKSPPAIIRGDRAASLMNLMVPRIESQLVHIQDPEAQAQLRARLDKLSDKVQIASANANEDRIRRDVELSIDVLEQSVEHKISVPDTMTP